MQLLEFGIRQTRLSLGFIDKPKKKNFFFKIRYILLRNREWETASFWTCWNVQKIENLILETTCDFSDIFRIISSKILRIHLLQTLGILEELNFLEKIRAIFSFY